jgi:hypothetical protein
MSEVTTTEPSVETCLRELREMFPDHARRISITEALLSANKVTIVVGGQSATYTRASLQQNLSECMAMAKRWHAAIHKERDL